MQNPFMQLLSAAVLFLAFFLAGCAEGEPPPEEIPTLEDFRGVWSTGVLHDVEFTGVGESIMTGPLYQGGEPGDTIISFIIDGDIFESYLCVFNEGFWQFVHGSTGALAFDGETMVLSIYVDEEFNDDDPSWLPAGYEVVQRLIPGDDAFAMVIDSDEDGEFNGIELKDGAVIDWSEDVEMHLTKQPETVDVEITINISPEYYFDGGDDMILLGISSTLPMSDEAPIGYVAEKTPTAGLSGTVIVTIPGVRPGNYLLGAGLSDNGGTIFVTGTWYGEIYEGPGGPVDPSLRILNVPVIEGNVEFDLDMNWG